jgi:hypothetical protein
MPRRLIALAVALWWAALPLPADDAPPARALSISGEFAFTGSEQCAYASAFGPPPVLQAIGVVITQTSTIQGTLTLAANGTGQLIGRIASVQTVPGSGATPAMQSSLHCTVTHSAGDRDAFRLERICRGTRLRGTGSEAAQTWSLTPIRETGHVSADLLTVADTELVVESLSVAGVNLPRLCHRSATATRIRSRR